MIVFRSVFLYLFVLSFLNLKGQLCSGTVGAPIFTEDFGSGPLYGPPLAPGITSYPYQTGVPGNGTYVISSSSNPSGTNAGYINDHDHTGNLNGYMMVVNSDYLPSDIYRKHVTGLCAGTTYVFSAYLANNNSPSAVSTVCGSTYVFANIKFQTEFPVGTVQGSVTSGNLQVAPTATLLPWIQYGFVFTTGPGQTSVDVVLKNNAPGGCGNDYVVDDITLSPCGPGISVSIVSPNNILCAGSSATLQSTYNSGNYVNPQYQWQFSSNNGATWNNIITATSANYVIPIISAADVGLYRLLASESGNIASPSCRIIAGPVTFTLSATSVNSATICSSQSATLTAHSATGYLWNTGATTNSIVVSPTVTTNYTVTGSSGACGSAVATVSVIPASSVAITGNTLICNGNTTTLTASGASTFTWSTGSTGNTIVVSPSTITTYSLLSSNSGNCPGVSSIIVDVAPQPVITVNSGTICSGDSFTLNPSGANSYTYSSGAQVVTPLMNSTYTVTGSNASGCTTSAISSISVIVQPTLSVNSSSICAGNSFTIIPAGAVYYTYSGGTSIVNPSSTTSYTITGSNSQACAFSNSVICTVVVVPRPILAVNSGTICEGSSFVLSPSGAPVYTFPGGSATVSPVSNASYTITGTTLSGCSSSVTCSVTVIPKPTFTLSARSASLCLGKSTVLNANGSSNYLWNTGQITPSISVTPSVNTVYSLTSTNISGTLVCSETKTILVTIVPQTTVSVFGDDSVCLGSSTLLYALGASSYSWSPVTSVLNATSYSTSVNPINTTIYTVTALSGVGCPGTGTIQINVNPVPHIYAGRDTTVNIDEPLVLKGIGDVSVGFLPTGNVPLVCNFCSVVEVNPKETTCYILQGENNHGCMAFDEICVNVTKDWDLYIPNTFTPNGDGQNDIFMPVGYGISQINLDVYNRWGSKIFKGNNETVGWDGKLNGKICEQGTYIYKIEIITISGVSHNKTGHLVLLDSNRRQ